MESIIEFISNNYAWFLTITIILLFALIGYIYDTKRDKTDLLKKQEVELDEAAIENIVAPEGKSLADVVTNSKNINIETKQVELVDKSILSDNENLEVQEQSNENI